MSGSADDELWRALWTGQPPLPTHRRRRLLAAIPSSPRCKVCCAPFRGVGRMVMSVIGVRRSAKNPNFCSFCDDMARNHPGGAEVELSLLFADVRGSTALAEGLSPRHFKERMERFYRSATQVLIDCDAFIDKLVGDEVVGLFLPGMVSPEHARKAVLAARALLVNVAQGARLPVGAGVHTGVAYVGTVEGSGGAVRDIAAVGDAVNTTARLASTAQAGEALISEAAYAAASLDLGEHELRHLQLKGKAQPIRVHVMRADDSVPAQ
ncbi:MAG: adenylate/guanylate cyclase domain-containing protein [Chloroflexota bacterium]